MRRWAWALVAVLLSPSVMAVSWSDPQADHQVGRPTHFVDGEPQYQWTDAGTLSWYPNVDIVSASIEETPAELVFTLHVAGPQAGPPPIPGGPAFDEFAHGFAFRVGQVEYHVGFTTWFSNEPMFAILFAFDLLGHRVYFPGFYQTPAEVLEDGWRGAIPKAWLRDEHLVPLREGDRLQDVRLFASDNGFSFGGPASLCPEVGSRPGVPGIMFCSWTVRDASDSLGDVEVKITPPGVGHLFLRMDRPYRLSNGLATTYLFEAELRNLEDVEDVVNVQVSNVPKGWEVRLPSAVRFTQQGVQTVPVAVTVPFEHMHGQSHFMAMTAVSQRNATASMETTFGVIFADPPQPAGHHDTLHLHAENWCPGAQYTCVDAYMNADPAPSEPRFGTGQMVNEAPGYRSRDDPTDVAQATQPARWEWEFPLRPSLGIGLDFDMSRSGRLSTALRFDDAWTGQVEATLLLQTYREDAVHRRVLATGSASGIDFPAGRAVGVDIDMVVASGSDLIHLETAQNVVLLVNVTDTTGTPGHARLGEGWMVLDEARLQLPLLDYHEPVDLSGLAFADLHIQRLNSTIKYVNPGKTTLFLFNVTNTGDRHVSLDWQVAGPAKYTAWARISPATTHLAPGGNGTVVVRVQPPTGATVADVAELLLVGTVRQDPSRQLYGRLVAAVHVDEDIPDEADRARHFEQVAKQANEANKQRSPVPLALAAVALALAAWRRRP